MLPAHREPIWGRTIFHQPAEVYYYLFLRYLWPLHLGALMCKAPSDLRSELCEELKDLFHLVRLPHILAINSQYVKLVEVLIC
jgi:hypothetical protein